jgi:hypothetical protein
MKTQIVLRPVLRTCTTRAIWMINEIKKMGIDCSVLGRANR